MTWLQNQMFVLTEVDAHTWTLKLFFKILCRGLTSWARQSQL